MRIYFDSMFKCIVVEGAKIPFPAQSLSVTRIGTRLTVWQADAQTRVARFDYTVLRDKNDDAFSSAGQAQTYLEGEFAKKGDLDDLPDFLANVQGVLT